MKLIYTCFFILIFCTSCKKNTFHKTKTTYKTISISNSLTKNDSIEAFISPYRIHLNNTLDSTLAYAPETYSKKDGDLNTAIGNFMADVVFSEGNPIFKARNGKDIDGVLLNHGGIRSVISKGNISARTAFEVMPFENSIVVAALNKEQMTELFNYLVTEQVAHPISNMQLVLGPLNQVNHITVNKKPLEDKVYYIATSDYLASGGDRMDFFKKADTIYNTDYKIRNALIDYFNKVDTLSPKIDNRFTKLN
jgi:2',3'-cyclic-nucleotide 2'-phosphodiesterase (5'-nucleotidase family)